MTSGSRLLDSSILAAYFRKDRTVRERLASHSSLLISVTTIGEMLYGAARSAKPDDEEQRVVQFAAGCAVIPVDLMTAAYYAKIKAGLAAKGKPIPENDIWIAASAMQHGLTLAARDEHFSLIDGLDFECW